ncbi:MAG: GDP-mannose 4,6-dehydratase [Planctomycetes bacterium]|nr:GDP-mannose 4,6-dehydratase [Planctomycetota bacterium]
MINWNNQRVLITGAGGFIGSHLTERLLALGANVTALLHYDSRPDRGNLELIAPDLLERLTVLSGDICDPFYMQDAVKGQDIVFHLAALIPIPYSYRAPASYIATNVQGTLNVCEAVKRAGVARLVHTSTSESYGTALRPSIDEDHPLQAQSPYAASKIAADKLVESYCRSFSLPAATIRPFNTFGPRQSARAVIPTILSQLLSGAKSMRLGSLDPARDFLFVEDTVEGFLAVAASDACVGCVTNVGTGKAVTIGELAELAMQLVGRRIEILTDDQRKRPQNSEVMNLICNASAAAARCGWTPRVSLRDGLMKVIEFIRANPQRFRPEEYTV